MSSRANVPLPSGYTTRPYRDEDYQDARKLFREGMGSLYEMVFKTSIRTIRMLLILLISFAVPYLAFSSFTWSAWKTYNSHVNNALEMAMSNIRSCYVSSRTAWFWVAEADGRLVGTVAIRQQSDRPLACQLMRMYVHQMHRRWGIASTLLDVALHEAKEFGYRVCVLCTSDVQYEAQRLYMRKGFKVMGKKNLVFYHTTPFSLRGNVFFFRTYSLPQGTLSRLRATVISALTVFPRVLDVV
uniref:N-acetyltransferase domain-containing protein n=1 Tax=Eptatretus burgeri TaxID=7764 RepID=A0A8C4R5S7_EPTBU